MKGGESQQDLTSKKLGNRAVAVYPRLIANDNDILVQYAGQKGDMMANLMVSIATVLMLVCAAVKVM